MNQPLQKLLLVCTILFLILKTTTATAQVDVLETLRYGLTHTRTKKKIKKTNSKNPKTKPETLTDEEKKLFTGKFSLLYEGDHLTINQIQYALDHGADINPDPIYYTSTPLIDAIKYKRDPKILEFLINHGALINPPDRVTPLMYAIQYKRDLKILEFLINHGADVNAKVGNKNKTPLMYAIKYKRDSKIIEFLINHGADVNFKVDNETPLMYAMSHNGSIDILQVLLKHGVKINNKNRLELFLTAIMYNKHAKIVDFLLKQDPKMIDQRSNMFSNSNYTSLELAIKYGTRTAEVMNTLLKYESPEKLHDNVSFLLDLASHNRNDTAIVPLLKYGANINYHEKEDGSTPLMNAIHFFSLATVKVLLEHGASIHSKNKKGMTALMWALFCYNHNNNIYHSAFPKMINLLLEYKPNLNVEDNDGETPLMLASSSLPLVKLLVKHGAKINFKNKNGETVLLYSSGEKHSNTHNPQVVTFLLNNGAKFHIKDLYVWGYMVNTYKGIQALLKHKVNINVKDNNGDTLLNYLAKGCSVDSLTLLLQHGAKANTANDELETPFLSYVRECHKLTPVLKLLLKNGANINGVDREQNTALLYAILYHNYSLVLFFLRHGANPNVKGTESALYSTKRLDDKVKMLDFLLNHGVKFTADDKYDWYSLADLSMVGKLNPTDTLNRLTFFINHGLNLNFKDYNHGMTLFSYVMYGRRHMVAKDMQTIVEFFFKHGANPNIKDQDGRTPFTYALINPDFPKIIELFLKHGANPNIKDQDGRTPFTYALINPDYPKRIELFFKHGANPNIKDQDGRTPFTYALKNPHNLKIIELFLKYGVNPNIKDKKGWSPFIYALTKIDNITTLELFLKNGAKINSKDENGWTPFMWACRYSKSIKVIDYLLLHGADINAKTNHGKTPLSISEKNPTYEVRDFLEDHGAKK